MKRYMAYFTTLLLVLMITDFCLNGELLHKDTEEPEDIPARLSSANIRSSQLPNLEEEGQGDTEELGDIIEAESCAFVRAAFDGDKNRILGMLYAGTEYMVSGDKSSYIRYTSEDTHVEGYMATDKKLVRVCQSWYVEEDDGSITSEVEVELEGEELPQTWYIHYRKVLGRWKIFMLEN
ncbi:MAG TPA: hypothetical protein VN549_07240 [Negativicutes bacterium]|nr:hypothetical protein [Negativicutes bacterium]